MRPRDRERMKNQLWRGSTGGVRGENVAHLVNELHPEPRNQRQRSDQRRLRQPL